MELLWSRGARQVIFSIVVGYDGTGSLRAVATNDKIRPFTDVVENFSTFIPNLAITPWERIGQMVETGTIPAQWQVGDEKDVILEGALDGEVLTFQIYGFDHDDLASGEKAAITFGMKDLMSTTRRMNTAYTNAGSFVGSNLYAWMVDELWNSLPADLRAVIKQVNKRTSAGNSSSVVNTNPMNLFLFSEIECFGVVNYAAANEGERYPIFTDDASRIKRLQNGAGSATGWWERSPNTSWNFNFCYVTNNGVTHSNDANLLYGVCFGFCV